MKTSELKQKQYKEIGQRIKSFRERAGLTQGELGKRIGRLSASAIYYIEQGERYIKVIDLIAIAEALLVSVDVLLSGELHCFDLNGRNLNSQVFSEGNPIYTERRVA